MFMPFDRSQQAGRQSQLTPMADATGTPFVPRPMATGGRPSTAERRDYREQADGAP
jgi:hypothetical protein